MKIKASFYWKLKRDVQSLKCKKNNTYWDILKNKDYTRVIELRIFLLTR